MWHVDFLEIENGTLVHGKIEGGTVVGAQLTNLSTKQVKRPRAANFREYANVKFDNAYYRNGTLCKKPGKTLSRKPVRRKKDEQSKGATPIYTIPAGTLPSIPDPAYMNTQQLTATLMSAVEPQLPQRDASPYALPKKFIAKAREITLVHAAGGTVHDPQWDYAAGDPNRVSDFGTGFYTCQTDEYPVKFARLNPVIMVNEYRFNFAKLKVLYLKDDVHWLLATAFHRENFQRRPELHSLRDWYREWVADCDVVMGTISDDNFFSTFTAFLADLMSDYVTLNIVQMMNYPLQIVSKSAKADKQFEHFNTYGVDVERVQEVMVKADAEIENMEELIRKRRLELRNTDKGLMFSQLAEIVKKELGLA